MKKALITGIAGQDGIYLAELLAKKGYCVHGIVNPATSNNLQSENINLLSDVIIHKCDILIYRSIEQTICEIKPDEVYHLASSVEPRVINNEEHSIFDINFIPGVNILNAVKNNLPSAKIYIAGSSLMFGNTSDLRQNETSPMRPNTPYGIAKVALYNFMKMYRNVYGINACMGILYNHESPRRSEKFLPRKISKSVAEIKSGKKSKLILGDISVARDWTFAGDVVISMWLMLQMDKPRDYVVGSGILHTVQDILEIAFNEVDLDWRNFVEINNNLFRKVEFVNLCADISRISNDLNWSPKVKFYDLIVDMVRQDISKEFYND